MPKKTWNFQLLPGKPGIISPNRYRMDSAGEAMENLVNNALPSYLKFHGVNKIVLQLGPSNRDGPLYSEILGVGTLIVPDFDTARYTAAPDEEKSTFLRQTIRQAFGWIIEQYPDSGSFKKALESLGWNE